MCESREEKDMAVEADKIQERLAELRKKAQKMNENIPVLKDGKNGAVELDSNNPSHKEWFEGR